MGGSGSGNWCQSSSRGICEHHKRIDIRHMRKTGMLVPGCSGSMSWSCGQEEAGNIRYRMHEHDLEVKYKYRDYGDGDWTPVNEHISVVEQEQPYGGYRRYFLCPGCERRCMVLYGGTYFRCRKCWGLAYASQHEDIHCRLRRKAEKIRSKLGGLPDVYEPYPKKPKGMHWKTYNRAINKCERLETIWDEGLVRLMFQLGGYD